MILFRRLGRQARAARLGGVEDMLGMAALSIIMIVLFNVDGIF